MVKWKADILTGIILLAFSIASFFYTYEMNVGAVTKIPSATPGYYVRIWVTIFGMLSLLLIISAYRHRKSDDKYPIIWYRLGVVTSVSTALYIFLMPYLGFNISTALFLFVLIYSYSKKMNKLNDTTTKRKRIIFYAVVSIVVMGICSIVFGELLQVILPEFSLF